MIQYPSIAIPRVIFLHLGVLFLLGCNVKEDFTVIDYPRDPDRPVAIKRAEEIIELEAASIREYVTAEMIDKAYNVREASGRASSGKWYAGEDAELYRDIVVRGSLVIEHATAERMNKGELDAGKAQSLRNDYITYLNSYVRNTLKLEMRAEPSADD